jgi:hypothetical protein
MTWVERQGRQGSHRCGAAASPRPSDAGPTSAAAAAHRVPATGCTRSRRNVPDAARRGLVGPPGIAPDAPIAG